MVYLLDLLHRMTLKLQWQCVLQMDIVSTNAAAVAKDVIKYEYNLADESQLLSGTATSGESTAQTD